MGALTLGFALPLLVASAPVAAAPVAADPVAQWRSEIAEASARFGIPVAWIERVMRAESGGRTVLGGRPVRSSKGAIGLMQLMPGTWAEMRARLGLGSDPDDPRDNILAGTFYLRLMYDRFGYPGLFGAYNAGPARYSAWLAGRARLPRETVVYLAKVGNPAGLAQSAGGATGVSVGNGAATPHASVSLFVVLRAPATVGNPPLEQAPLEQAPLGQAPLGQAPQPVLFAIRKDRQ